MKPLLTRTLSAIIALLVLGALFYFFREFGLHLLIYAVVVLGGFELSRILFHGAPSSLRWIHWLMTMFVFVFSSHGTIHEKAVLFVVLFTLANILFTVFCLLLHEEFGSLDKLLSYIAKSAMGFGYILLLPTIAAWILYSENGTAWFFTMLITVFASDIGAYLAGSRWGKTLLAPLISPKKSLEGLIGGLCFSTAASLSCSFLLPHVPFMIFICLGLTGGVVGVAGDFFESLMKRIADVKDSGHLMPGHGGVLDRVDSVLFTTPLFLVASLLYTF